MHPALPDRVVPARDQPGLPQQQGPPGGLHALQGDVHGPGVHERHEAGGLPWRRTPHVHVPVKAICLPNQHCYY